MMNMMNMMTVMMNEYNANDAFTANIVDGILEIHILLNKAFKPDTKWYVEYPNNDDYEGYTRYIDFYKNGKITIEKNNLNYEITTVKAKKLLEDGSYDDEYAPLVSVSDNDCYNADIPKMLSFAMNLDWCTRNPNNAPKTIIPVKLYWEF